MPKIKQPSPAAQKAEEAERKITAAVGNTNQEQIDKRNAIADRADEYRQADLEDTDGDKIVPRDPEEARAEAEAQETERERARLEAEAAEDEARRLQEEGTVTRSSSSEPPRRYTIKVNGRDLELSEEELISRASKVSSADEYLQTAAEAVKRATASAPSEQDVSASDAGGITEDTLTSALQGDREAIRKIAQRLNGPSTDVLQAVDDRMTFRDAVRQFRSDYADVCKDPNLYSLVVAKDSELAKSEPNLGYEERLKKAGDSVRNWIKGYGKPAETVNPKLLRKQQSSNVPAAGSRQATRDEDDSEAPVGDVIDAMAKARGQTEAIRTPQGMFGKS
jgi:hypothetical protein